MKKFLQTSLILLLSVGIIYAAPRPKIVNQFVTPDMLKTVPALTPDSCTTTGLNSVPNKLFVYLSVFNFGDTTSIQSKTWTMLSKPSGSAAAITNIPSLNWVKFRTDIKGTYEVKCAITTSSGSKDTTIKIYSSDFVGTGGFYNVPATYPNCMSCHGATPAFVEIFNKWKVSGHANIFRYNIDSGSAGYGTSCMKCHTTGYDHNLFAINGGFDDKARDLGWSWTNFSPPKKGNWDTLKNRYPSLVALSSIGCENCHGAGSEHATGGDDAKIQISYDTKACASCHDEPWRHNIYSQYKNSLHSHAVFEGRAVADSLRNQLGDCNRCHDGESFIGYTKNLKYPVNSTKADQVMIGCPTCHDPHGNSNEFSLRTVPAGADTLANGYHYSSAGTGKLCISCHSARRDNRTYITVRGSFSSTWGPHENPQGDVLLGQNLATFGFPYMSGSHKNISGACVGCHMSPTTDTGTVTRDKVGGHSWNMSYAATNFDNVSGCEGCHPGKTSFDDFVAPEDYDGNGLTETWQKEVDGCIKNLRIALPPVGVDSVSWQMIARDSTNLNLRKAYWNYLMITKDYSRGMHNPFLAINVLQVSKNYAVGINQLGTEIPKVFELAQNYPNPFNPTTKINFAIPSSETVTIKVFDLTGREISTLISGEKLMAGKYTTDFDGSKLSSGVYFYRITAGAYNMTKKMILVK
jgi:hypothetical protein